MPSTPGVCSVEFVEVANQPFSWMSRSGSRLPLPSSGINAFVVRATNAAMLFDVYTSVTQCFGISIVRDFTLSHGAFVDFAVVTRTRVRSVAGSVFSANVSTRGNTVAPLRNRAFPVAVR